MDTITAHLSKPIRDKTRVIAQDEVSIHRQIVSKFMKISILESWRIVARREASRALKSGGRGPVFAINLCNVLDSVPSKRLTFEVIEAWLNSSNEPAEVHVSSEAFSGIELPNLPDEHGLTILEKPVSVLAKSSAYPYGITENLISKLHSAKIQTVGELFSYARSEFG